MTQSTMQRETIIVETLLNTLEAERYVRGPLLLIIVDELSGRDGLESAANAARRILEGLDSGELGEAEFVARIAALRQLIDGLARSAPASARFLMRPVTSPASAA